MSEAEAQAVEIHDVETGLNNKPPSDADLSTVSSPDGKESTPHLTMSEPGDVVRWRECCHSDTNKMCNAFSYVTHLSYWKVEDESFWQSFGKYVGNKNLWISIPNLLIGFSVWLIWSVLIVRMKTIYTDDGGCDEDPVSTDCHRYFTFEEWENEILSDSEYQSLILLLPAIAGLTGATLRLTNTFMIAVAGAPVTTSMTSLLFLVSMLLLSVALFDSNTSFGLLIVAAAVSGAGGGAFSSSMNNIAYFFPKAGLGLALGLNAGIGNLGVSVTQLIIPIMMDSVYLGGDQYTSAEIAPQNAGLFWLPFIFISMFMAWFFLNSLPIHDAAASKPRALVAYWWLELIGFAGAAVAVIVLIITRTWTDPWLKILRGVMLLAIALGVTMLLLIYATKFAFLGKTSEKLKGDFAIFKLKHTWIMTYLYIMTFGSFIGYSSVFPTLLSNLFPNEEVLNYSWMGAFVGSIIRPVGGWLSDKYGGALVTSISIFVTILATVAVGIVVLVAKNSDDPDSYFVPFLLLFLVMFLTTGIGNGSTFRMVPMIFSVEHKGPVLGWIAAVAAYGAFIFPIIFGVSISEDVTEYAMFGFAAYYLTVWIVNWWYYARKNAEIKC